MRALTARLRFRFSAPTSLSVPQRSTISSPRKRDYSFPQCLQASSLPDISILRSITSHNPDSASVIHSGSGRTFTYGNLVADIILALERLRRVSEKPSTPIQLRGKPVAFLAENSYDYVVTLLSIIAADAIALPLSPSFPVQELRYILNNSEADILLATEKYHTKAEQTVQEGLGKTPVVDVISKREVGANVITNVEFKATHQMEGGMMLYTSGTTNRPKGVFLPHSSLDAQTDSLIRAWSYSKTDRLLHLLPLHHIHGTVNAILAPLRAGSSVEFMFPFNPTAVWNRLGKPFISEHREDQSSSSPITFLTAVPTTYHRLLATHKDLPAAAQEAAKVAISPDHLRLNISGSAALPTPIKVAWRDLSGGNVLLERFGMTEVGMAISCGLDFNDRVDGSVGWPLPSVEARLFDLDRQEVIHPGNELDSNGRERLGEIQIRGPTIFKEYWRNEAATKESFIDDPDMKGRWFKTGDMAIRKHVEGPGQSGSNWATGPMYFIQGRESVDIIKVGGEKVSALEVERELLALPQVVEAAVVGLPSDRWGQKVAVVLVLDSNSANTDGTAAKPWNILDMRRALRERLAEYKIPQEMRVLKTIPRNAMGKVNKKTLVRKVFSDMI
ncbi:hypothetical protein FQN57_002059 [Myotisia sp. PD_48]|nr:hypothetical protein FQN57_002059 [Myotisia sp. PD_48]